MMAIEVQIMYSPCLNDKIFRKCHVFISENYKLLIVKAGKMCCEF